MIRQQQVSVTTTGANGSAAGTGQTGVMSGYLVAVHIDYTSQPATTDVTIATSNAPVRTLLTVSNANTDKWFYPRVLLQDTDGADLTAVYDRMPVNDHIGVTVAQGDNNGLVVVTLYVECR